LRAGEDFVVSWRIPEGIGQEASMAILPSQASETAERYRRDGYVILRNVLDAETIAEADRHVAWLIEKNPTLRPEQLHNTRMTDDPFWVRLVSDPRLLDVAEQFIGPDIALFASHYICKPPFTGQPVLWHQDGGYWPLDPMEVVTLWLAVDNVTSENGCMRVIPGTQTLQLIEMEGAQEEAVLDKQTPAEYIDESKAVDIVLSPGDVEVHHPNIIHGSHANTSPMRRCGLTIRYIPTTTKVTSNEPWAAASLFHLRGKRRENVNEYLPFPKFVEGRHMSFRGCETWK
jgi:phytanoyl-CoA hydroxylase